MLSLRWHEHLCILQQYWSITASFNVHITAHDPSLSLHHVSICVVGKSEEVTLIYAPQYMRQNTRKMTSDADTASEPACYYVRSRRSLHTMLRDQTHQVHDVSHYNTRGMGRDETERQKKYDRTPQDQPARDLYWIHYDLLRMPALSTPPITSISMS